MEELEKGPSLLKRVLTWGLPALLVVLIIVGLSRLGGGDATPVGTPPAAVSSTSEALPPSPTASVEDEHLEDESANLCVNDAETIRRLSSEFAVSWNTINWDATTADREEDLRRLVAEGFFDIAQNSVYIEPDLSKRSLADRARTEQQINQRARASSNTPELFCMTTAPTDATTTVAVDVWTENELGDVLVGPIQSEMTISWSYIDNRWQATLVS